MIRGLLFALWASTTSLAAQTDDAARAALDQLLAADALLAAANSGEDRVAALTQTVRAYEDALAAVRDGLRRMSTRRQALELALAARSDDIARLLATLQTMGDTPSPLLMLHPSGPLGTARAGMMISDLTPALQAEVDQLRADLGQIQSLQQAQDTALAALGQGLASAQTARTALIAAMEQRTDLPQRFRDDPARLANLLAASQTLEVFATGLQNIAGDPNIAAPDAGALKGTLPLPVDGRLLRRFGEPDAAGILRPGWVIATRAGALVTTPVAATIRFQGPFLDYGTVVILEPAPDVLFVLAGLGTALGEVGQIIPAGSPIGIIGGQPPTADAILTDLAIANAGSRTETLYLEVRDGQSAIDPLEWFADAN